MNLSNNSIFPPGCARGKEPVGPIFVKAYGPDFVIEDAFNCKCWPCACPSDVPKAGLFV